MTCARDAIEVLAPGILLDSPASSAVFRLQLSIKYLMTVYQSHLSFNCHRAIIYPSLLLYRLNLIWVCGQMFYLRNTDFFCSKDSGPARHVEADFSESAIPFQGVRRYCSPGFFTRKNKNGEVIWRNWLCYSPATKSCIACHANYLVIPIIFCLRK